MILGHELFCGKEDSSRGAPFQADQCDRIFRVLSLPSTATWPSVGQLPHYQRVDAWRREKVYPTESTLDRVRARAACLRRLPHAVPPFLRGYPPQALQLPRHSAKFDLVARMLVMDPDRRITAREALEHPYFIESVRASCEPTPTRTPAFPCVPTRRLHNSPAPGATASTRARLGATPVSGPPRRAAPPAPDPSPACAAGDAEESAASRSVAQPRKRARR